MKLSSVIFPHPIAKAPTHQREQHFSTAAGWVIERDDAGDFHLVGHGLDFWTDGSASWVPAVTPTQLQTFDEPPSKPAAPFVHPNSKKGRRG